MGKTADANAPVQTGTVSPHNPGHTRPTTGGEATEVDRARFELLRSALYHDMRETSLTRVHKLALFITILLGSSAIAALGSDYPLVGQIAGGVVATLGAAQLVWDFGGVARTHGDLRKRFYGLLADAEGGGDIASLKSKMTLIYADEPPLKRKVNERAHNRAGESIYGDDFNRA